MPRNLKIRSDVTVPVEFRDFMKHVAHLIATGDEGATLISDDLLQCERAYGGLGEDGTFEFRYFPGDDVEYYWDVCLTASQISNIAEGITTDLPVWRCPNAECLNRHWDEDSYCPNCDDVNDYV